MSSVAAAKTVTVPENVVAVFAFIDKLTLGGTASEEEVEPSIVVVAIVEPKEFVAVKV